MDLTTTFGLIVGIGAILGGQMLEGGGLGTLCQFTAFMIVFGGTCGAVLVSTPGPQVLGALKSLKRAFAPPKLNLGEIVSQLLSMAVKARRDGLLTLESEVAEIPDRFLNKAFTMAVDGATLETLIETMQTEIEHYEEEHNAYAKVFENAGGFSPTIGIIGAVLGLIAVMQNLSDASKLGEGIAVAFVATVYGVSLANLILIPIGNKLKARVKEDVARMNLMLQGVSLIYSGENQHMLEQRLKAFIGDHAAEENGKGTHAVN